MTVESSFLLSTGELTVPCWLTEPDTGEIRRIVLGVHGLGGSANDAIQTGLAEEMELFYAASLRFDFPCHGENACGELTLNSCVDTLLTVAKFARERYPQVEDLCIFASGFGAYISLLALQDLLEMPGRVKLVVQTPSLRMHDTILNMKNISEPTLKAMERFTLNAPRPFDVTYRFYQELRENFAMGTYPIPILILHGEADAYIPMEDIYHFRRINERAKLVIIPGTSHRFLEEGAWDMVLDLTRDWFEFEQVLCCDWE